MRFERLSSDKAKKLVLAGLLLVLAGVIIYQLFFSKPPRPALKPQAQPAAAAPIQNPAQAERAGRRSAQSGKEEVQLEALLSDLSPLDLSVLSNGRGASGPAGQRNIFEYAPPPPPKPQPPPPPPPITLRHIQPQVVYAGTPQAVTLAVIGSGFPQDAQIFFGGAPKPTARVSATELRTEIAPAEYALPRQIPVEVKSQSDPVKLYSNSIPFISQELPPPPVRMVGRMGEYGVFEVTTTRDFLRLRRGDKIQGAWLIESISDAGADIIHTQYQIRKRIPFEEVRR